MSKYQGKKKYIPITPQNAFRKACLRQIVNALNYCSSKKVIPFVETFTIHINSKTTYPPPENERIALSMRFPMIRDEKNEKDGDWEYFYLFCEPVMDGKWLSRDKSRWWYAVGSYATIFNHPDEENPFSDSKNIEIYDIDSFLSQGFPKFLKKYKKTIPLIEGESFLF